MAAHEIRDEAAGGHDPDAPPTRVIERGADKLRANAVPFIGARHLGMGENQPIALLMVDRDREAVRRIELVTAERPVVPHGHHAAPAVTAPGAPRARTARMPRNDRHREPAPTIAMPPAPSPASALRRSADTPAPHG